MPNASLAVVQGKMTTVAVVKVRDAGTGPHIYNITGKVRWNGGALLSFQGPPDRSVEWRILQGNGSLFPFTSYTDKLGRASARFDAGGIAETVIVGVAYIP